MSPKPVKIKLIEPLQFVFEYENVFFKGVIAYWVYECRIQLQIPNPKTTVGGI